MRLWSIHPKYLDSKGLTACWREALLAKKVLEGKTKGYKNHSQLIRFKNDKYPIHAINTYLYYVCKEALQRQYKYDWHKYDLGYVWADQSYQMMVNYDQVQYEFLHLLRKLMTRDRERYNKIRHLKWIEPHPLFKVVAGEIESWEKIKQ